MGNCGGKGAAKAKKGLKKLERKAFKTTELPEIDDFFTKIQTPMDTVCDLSETVSGANESILALMEADEVLKGLERTLKAILKFMKEDAKKSGNDFTLVIGDDGKPSLEPREEPKGVSAKIYVEVKKLIDAVKEVIERVPGLKDEITEAGTAAKDLPQKAQSDATSSGLNPLQTAKALKFVGDNIKYLGGFPNDVTEFLNNIKELTETLKDVFGPDSEKSEGGEQHETKE